jgi:hypothetical protein
LWNWSTMWTGMRIPYLQPTNILSNIDWRDQRIYRFLIKKSKFANNKEDININQFSCRKVIWTLCTSILLRA